MLDRALQGPVLVIVLSEEGLNGGANGPGNNPAAANNKQTKWEPQRALCEIEDMSPVGVEAFARAQAESSLRNEEEPTKSEYIAALLDLRLVIPTLAKKEKRFGNTVDIPQHRRLTDAQMVDAKQALKEKYVAFGVCKHEFEEAAKTVESAKEDAEAEEEATAAAAATQPSPDKRYVLGSSEEEEEHGEAAAAAMPAAINMPEKLGAEFEKAFKNWKRLGMAIDWKKEFASELSPEQLDKPELCPFEDLMHVPIARIYKRLEDAAGKEDAAFYGHLLSMARTYIGGNMSESFCERVLSVANDVMTTGNTLLKADHLKKIVLLRVNRRFMEYMREHRKDVVLMVAQKKGMQCAENLAGIRVQRQGRRKAAAATKRHKA